MSKNDGKGTHGNAGSNPGHSGGKSPGNTRPGNSGTGGGRRDDNGGRGTKR